MKNIYRYLAVFVMAVVVTTACVKDERHSPRPDEFSIRTAKTFFEGFGAPIQLEGLNAASRSGDMPPIVPLWGQSRMVRFRGLQTVEVPLNITDASIFFGTDETFIAKEATYENAVYRLLSVDYEGEILYSIATYIADRSYLDSLPGILDDMSLRDMPAFSGRIMYYTLSGSLIGGVVYRDGYGCEAIAPAEGGNPQNWPFLLPAVSRSIECHIEVSYVWSNSVLIWEDGSCTPILLKKRVETMVCTSTSGPKTNDFDPDGTGGLAPVLPPVAPTDTITLDEIVVQAKCKFKGNLNDDQWKEIAKKLVKINSDCMGQKMYSELSRLRGDGELGLAIDPNIPELGNYFNKTVTLRSVDGKEWIFMHEMFHGYQNCFMQGATWNDRLANLEMEARMAHIMFYVHSIHSNHGTFKEWKKRYDEIIVTDPASIAIYGMISEYLDSKGNLLSGKTESGFLQRFNQIAEKHFSAKPGDINKGLNMDNNLKRLREILKDC